MSDEEERKRNAMIDKKLEHYPDDTTLEDKIETHRHMDLDIRLEKLEEKVNKKERLDKMYIGTSQDAWDKIKELEQKIGKNSEIELHTLTIQKELIKKVNTLSAVLKETINYLPIESLYKRQLKNKLKQLDGTPKGVEGEPLETESQKYCRKIKEEQEAPFPQPPVSRDTSILKDVKVGEAEPVQSHRIIRDLIETMEHDIKTTKEIENKLIAEFLGILSAIYNDLGIYSSREVRPIVDNYIKETEAKLKQ